MTDVDPQWYFTVASAMRTLAVDIKSELERLQYSLRDMANSAGNHSSAGHTWASTYDQVASNIFETASLTAIACDNLGAMTHTAGVERLRVQNENSPGKPDVAAPALAIGSELTMSLHPVVRSTGGLNDPPAEWDIVADRIDKKWADCDVSKIKNAGGSWREAASTFTLLAGGVPPETTAADPPPEVPRIDFAVGRIQHVTREVALWSKVLADACTSVGEFSDTEREQITNLLRLARITIFAYSHLPRQFRLFGKSMADFYRQLAVQHVRQLLEELDAEVAKHAESMGGIKGSGEVTNLIQLNLSPMLGRYARPDKPVRGGTNNRQRGEEGERRAGIPDEKKDPIYPPNPRSRGGYRIPDLVDDANRQVTEVKNTNSTRRSDAQILDETEWAESRGYTMTLITDHRTTISPVVQQLSDEGRITILRMELDENLSGAKPAPFLPEPGWHPPPSDPTKPKESTRTGVPTP